MFYIGLYREVRGKFSCLKLLIFGMKHHLMDLYQVCSNYDPVAKNGPAPGVTYFTLAYIGENMEKSSCLKP